MRPVVFSRTGILCAIGAILTACTAAPELQKYPRTQIDRPHTLPKGVAAWGIVAPYLVAKDVSGSTGFPPIPLPLFWKSSLSDKVTLNWFLLPLQVSIQLDYTEDQLLGLDAGLQGIGYASGDIGFLLTPAVSLLYRRKLSNTVAAEGTVGGSFTVRTGRRGSSWDFGVSLGPRFQLSELWSIRPAIATELSYQNPEVLHPAPGAALPPKTTGLTVPLSLALSWSVGRQWDLGLTYGFRGIGEKNQYQSHSGTLSAIHYW